MGIGFYSRPSLRRHQRDSPILWRRTQAGAESVGELRQKCRNRKSEWTGTSEYRILAIKGRASSKVDTFVIHGRPHHSVVEHLLNLFHALCPVFYMLLNWHSVICSCLLRWLSISISSWPSCSVSALVIYYAVGLDHPSPTDRRSQNPWFREDLGLFRKLTLRWNSFLSPQAKTCLGSDVCEKVDSAFRKQRIDSVLL